MKGQAMSQEHSNRARKNSARVPSYRLRKAMLKIIERAGVKVWPKLFKDCRSSREMELTEECPAQVVCAWIGNSPQVAAKQ